MTQEIHRLVERFSYFIKLEYMSLESNISPKIRIDDAIKDIEQLRETLKVFSNFLKELEQ